MKSFVKYLTVGCFAAGSFAFFMPISTAQMSSGGLDANAPAAEAPATQPAESGEMIDSPIFEAWKAYGVGSSATYKMTMNQGAMNFEATVKQSLKSITDDKAVINTNTKMNFMGQANEQDNESSVEAKVDKSRKWLMAGGDQPMKEEGTESITILGKTYEATKLTMDINKDGETAKGVAYYSKEVPGGLLKMTIDGTTQMGPIKIAMELSEFEAK